MSSICSGRRVPKWIAAACVAACCVVSAAQGAAADAGAVQDLSWLFPLNPPGAITAKPSNSSLVHLPNSRLSFTDAQLTDLYFAPDWHPESHAPMPEIVLHGRAPGTYACGYCHLPSGAGRPENAALAGLPAAYIVQQVADMKSGARRSAWHGSAYRPVDLMREVAANVAAADLAVAAEYFAAQPLQPRVTVIQRKRIPRMEVMSWIYTIDPRGGEEILGRRLIEWAPDPSRHEQRDDEMRYNVFVPPGSVHRGSEITRAGVSGHVASCASCHGEHLQGMGLIPPLAGRSPSYLLRQLVAFKTKDRAGSGAAPMQAVAAALDLTDMIAVAAYAAAQSPLRQSKQPRNQATLSAL